jgi:hypothetical protein
MAEQHGETISVKSSAGKETDILFSLPKAQ